MAGKELLKSAGINLDVVHCPSCGEKLPPLRIPDSVHQMLWGGFTCPKCQCRMDKWGKAVNSSDEANT
jgi:recombinational DNA repair protein (RecF pathway)